MEYHADGIDRVVTHTAVTCGRGNSRNWISTFMPEIYPRRNAACPSKNFTAYTRNSRIDNEIHCSQTRNGERRLECLDMITLSYTSTGKIISTLSSGERYHRTQQAEQELHASEERFRQLANNIEEVILDDRCPDRAGNLHQSCSGEISGEIRSRT